MTKALEFASLMFETSGEPCGVMKIGDKVVDQVLTPDWAFQYWNNRLVELLTEQEATDVQV